MQLRKLSSASGLIEGMVRDAKGRKLGEIEDFILDLNAGKVEYAVFSFGGLCGLGSKLCAVAPDLLELDEGGKYFRLDYDKRSLGEAPEIDKRRWPYLSWAGHPSRIYVLRNRRHRRSEQSDPACAL